jgi:hypothetical protein
MLYVNNPNAVWMCAEVWREFRRHGPRTSSGDWSASVEIRWEMFGRKTLRRERGTVGPRLAGGGGGIRTHERLAPLPIFKTGAFNRSATPPSLVFQALIAFLLATLRCECRFLRTLVRLRCKRPDPRADTPVIGDGGAKGESQSQSGRFDECQNNPNVRDSANVTISAVSTDATRVDTAVSKKRCSLQVSHSAVTSKESASGIAR